MSNLGKALKTNYEHDKIGVPWKSLSDVLTPLRGNLIVCLGAPGQGKSALALNWALKLTGPSLLLSLDTDLTTQAIRTASVLSGQKMEEIKKHPHSWAEYVEHEAWKTRAYDIHLSPRHILDLIQAEEEYWGEAPALTVVDNVSNLIQEGGYEEYRSVFTDLHRVARKGKTCILALHHIKRESSTPSRPLGLFSGQYSGEQEAEMVLGLWSRGQGQELYVSIDKNRSGQASPDGSLYCTLNFDRETMRIEEPSDLEAYRQYVGGSYVGTNTT